MVTSFDQLNGGVTGAAQLVALRGNLLLKLLLVLIFLADMIRYALFEQRPTADASHISTGLVLADCIRDTRRLIGNV